MNPLDFITGLVKHARQSEASTGIHYLATLAQAAHESGWGKFAPGNMYFGVKDTDGINGNEQLLTTFEYSRSNQLKFPVIISIEPVILSGQKYFKYVIKDYFRKYNSAEECFTDHGKFFLANSRYAEALKVRHNYILFIDAIAKAGYATDPKYASLLKSIAGSIEQIILKKDL